MITNLLTLPGSGAGYKYRGSFVYSVDASGNERLESVACDEGQDLRDVQQLWSGVLPGRLAREGLPW